MTDKTQIDLGKAQVRELRHAAHEALHDAYKTLPKCALLGGQPGLTKDEQAERLDLLSKDLDTFVGNIDQFLATVKTAQAAIAKAKEIVENRDLDAHKIAKEQNKEDAIEQVMSVIEVPDYPDFD